MSNNGMTARIDRGRLIVEIPLSAPTKSKSGKSFVVASTHGNQQTSAQVELPGEGQGRTRNVIVGLNAYVKE